MLQELFIGKTDRESAPRARKLRFESLETRELLSVSEIAPREILQPTPPDPLALVSSQQDAFSAIPINLDSSSTEYAVQHASVAVLVTTSSDVVDASDGVISLREALSTSGVSQISFDASLQGQTISLSSELPSPPNGVVVDASALWDAELGAPGITIDANSQSRVFSMNNRTVTLSGLRIAHGRSAQDGGAIYAWNSNLTVDSCVFEENVTTGGGGGAIYGGNTTIVVTNSQFYGNAGVQGGAFHLYGESSSLKLSNTVVAENTADWGAFATSWDAPITIWNSTIANNTATSGGGAVYIRAGGVNAYNSIFALNSATWNDDVQRTNCSFNAYNCLVSGYVNDNLDENIIVHSDESIFIAPENRDYRLSLHSKAVDAGLVEYAVAPNGSSLTTDARGAARTVGKSVDLGAYEYNPETDPYVDPTLADTYVDYIVAPPYYDADKYSQEYDWNQCWAGAASSMQWATLWGRLPGLEDEEDLFHTMFGSNFPNEGGNTNCANAWLLNNEYYSDKAKTPGGYYSDLFSEYGETASLYCKEVSVTVSSLVEMAARLRSGVAVGFSIANYNTTTGARTHGHALSAYGYSYNPALDPTDPNYITRLYFVDSNDGGRMTNQRDRKLKSLDLKWTEGIQDDGSVNAYVVTNYTLGPEEAGPVVLEYLQFLMQRPSKYAPDGGASANLYIAEKLTDAPITFTASEEGTLNPTTFMVGEEVSATFTFQSTTNLSSSVKCKVLVDDEPVATVDVDAVAQGESAPYTVSLGRLPQGAHFVTVAVDSEDAVAESNDADNAFSTAITITPDDSVVVTTASDVVDPNDGLVSLREAVSLAGTSGNSSRITFDASLRGATITLSGDKITLERAVIIDASELWDVANARPGITVDGDKKSYLFEIYNVGDVKFVGLEFTGGSNSGWGGAFNATSVSLTIDQCWFTENYASGPGGAINAGGCDITILNSVFRGNSTSYQGGAIYLAASNRSVYIANSLFAENSADWGGFAMNWGVDMTIVNSTVVKNTATNGGGVMYAQDATVTFYNSIMALNTAGWSQEFQTSNATVTGYNSISSTEVWSGGANNLTTGSSALFANADGGDYRLAEDSIALDYGANEYAVDAKGGALQYDLVGATRIANGVVDAGAYEYQVAAEERPSTVVTTAEDVMDAYDGLISLREAIEVYSAAGDTITFTDEILRAENVVIRLGSSPLIIDKSLTITGAGIALDGHGETGLLEVAADVAVVEINGLVLRNGLSSETGTAILVRSGATLKLVNSLVEHNPQTAVSGNQGSNIEVVESVFTDNKTAIYVNNDSNLRVLRSTFHGNAGSSTISSIGSTTDISYSQFYNNSSKSVIFVGEYIFNDFYTGELLFYPSQTTISNSVIVDNTGNAFDRWSDGDLDLSNPNGEPRIVITNVTIANNGGYGLTLGGGTRRIDVKNSIVVNNQQGDVSINYSFIKLSNTLTGSIITTDEDSDEDGNVYLVDGGGNLVYNRESPLFVDNSYELSDGSQAVDVGNNEYALGEYDLAGNARIQGDAVDLGAYEKTYVEPEHETPSTVVTTALDVVDATDGLISLREALEVYSVEGDTITFSENLRNATITLERNRNFGIGKNLTIDALSLWNDATNTPGLTLAGNEYAILAIAGEIEVAINGITLTRGNYSYGGAAYIYQADVTFNNCVISGNSSRGGNGGAICVHEGSAVFNNCVISNNTAYNQGGGVYVHEGKATFVDSVIAENSATIGGGVYNWKGKVEFVNCSVADNSATYFGGGVTSDGAATFDNCLITGNTSTISGGAVTLGYNFAAKGTFINCTITDNSTGVFLDRNANLGATEFYNSIIVNNGATDVLFSGSNNVNARNTLSSFSEWSNANDAGVVNYVYNSNAPLFTDAATGDYTLAQGSQAINKGNNSYVTTTVDLAGNTRIQGDVVDLGAYEGAFDEPEPETPSVVVTTALDVVDAYDGLISLREALEVYAVAGDTITFVPELKNKTITLNGTQLEITKSLTIDASSLWNADTQTPGVTVDGAAKSLVFYVSANNEVEFNGLLITNGNSGGYGGGVFADHSNLTFFNCAISGNTTSSVGGGVDIDYGNGTFINCVISDNNSQGNGGGVFITRGIGTFTSCIFSGNETVNRGGGVYIGNATTGIFTDCVIVNNTAIQKGAGVQSFGDVTFVNCEISSNTCTHGTSEGGGVCVWNGATVFTNCSITGNTASRGGGVSFDGASNTFTNCTIAGNVGAGMGGGALAYGAATFTNCTIAGNSSPNGGGAYIGASVTFTNSVVVQNGVDLALQNSSGSALGYNTLSSFTGWSNASVSGVVNYVYDTSARLFKDAATGDYTLAQGSQAIDKGNNAYVTTESDLVGGARIYNGIVDLGAYELQTVYETPSVVVTTLADVVDPYDELISLREAIEVYSVEGDTITFAESLSGGTITLGGQELAISKTLSIDGSSLAQGLTVNGSGASRVFNISNSPEVELVGLTLTGGSADNGGAILATGGTLDLTNCFFTSNSAQGVGGALALNEVTTTITGGGFSGNSAGSEGGAIRMYLGSVTVSGASFTGNSAYYGGALRMEQGEATLDDVGFTNNSANYGGAIQAYGAVISAINSDFVGGIAQIEGGAFNVNKCVSVEVNGCNFSENSATTNGGAVFFYVWDQSSVLPFTSINSVYRNNTAGRNGGAIATNYANVTVEGGEFVNNSVPNGKDGSVEGEGGAIRTEVGSIAVSGATFTANNAAIGGALRLQAGEATISDSTFTDNIAIEFGGAIQAWNAPITVESSDFTGNTCAGRGGAIQMIAAVSLETTACNFTENTASEYGGAIDFGWSSASSQFVSTASNYTGNEVGNNGGAIHLFSATATINGGALTNNSADGVGGAVYVNSGELTISDAVLTGNRALSGGAVQALGLPFVITNSLVADNTGEYGGAFHLEDVDSTITNCTIANNEVGTSGGGIYFKDPSGVHTTTIANSIIALNVAPDGSDMRVITPETTTVVGYSNLTSFTDWNSGSGNATYDASCSLFATGGYELAPDSQAVDVGNNDYVVDSYDLVGKTRIVNNVVDLGAYEFQSVVESPSLVVTTAEDVVNVSDGLISLREAIEVYSVAGDTITFAPSLSGQSITLNGSELPIAKSLTIDASALQDGITIDADGKSRVFSIIGDENALDVALTNVTIEGGSSQSGGGIRATGSGVSVTLTDCYLTHNTSSGDGGALSVDFGSVTIIGGGFSANSTSGQGAAIHTYNARLTATDVSFDGNVGNSWGGALHIYGSPLTQITRSVFTNNTGENGGAIQFHDTTLTITDSEFTSNVATVSGGALNGYHSTVTIKGGEFTGNSSSDQGGAIRTEYGTIALEGVTFTNNTATNHGGALRMEQGEATVIDSIFTGNSAGYYGGAIQAYRAPITASGSFFTDNVAGAEGGAIKVNSALTVQVTDCEFTNNRTEYYGGAIRLEGGSLEVEDVKFVNNHTNTSGGAVQLHESSLTITDAEFTGNSANGAGGAIQAWKTPTTITNTTFTNNSADGGGAIEQDGNGFMQLESNTFIENTALSRGGAVLVYQHDAENPTFISIENRYESNEAGQAGGALYLSNMTTTIQDDVYVNNTATNYGGAINTEWGAAIVDGASFTGNTTGIGGGAINFHETNAELTDTVFTSNASNDVGGAIRFNRASGILTGANFTTNSATNVGGAIHVDSGGLAIDRSEFTGNSVELNGGAIQSVHTPTTITNSSFTNNTASSGGAILQNTCPSMIVSASEFTGNESTMTGGAVMVFADENAEESLFNSTNNAYSSNLATDHGAALALVGMTTTSVNDAFTNNTSGILGGAVRLERGTAAFTNARFVGNSGVWGGAVQTSGGTITMTNSLLAENTATYGGGLCGEEFDLQLTNCTIANNVASDSGDGVYISNTSAYVATIANSIILQNGAQDVYLDKPNATVNGYSNLTSYDAWTTGSDNITYSPSRPLFVEGGYELAQGSQAANVGNNAYVTLEFDLAGNDRIYGGIVDLGAYELQAPVEEPSVVVTTSEDVVDPTDGLISLREAIEVYSVAGDTVTFAPELQNATITLNGAQLEIPHSLTLDASALWNAETGTPGITLDGAGRSRVLNGDASDAEYGFIGLTITNGDATSSYGAGGGAQLSGSSIFVDCVITGNRAADGGGLNLGRGEFTNCTISNNVATSGSGGGAFIVSGTLTNCVIKGNSADISGGGLVLYGASAMTNCYVIENVVARGDGAGLFKGSMTAEESSYVNCVFADNIGAGRGSRGGGVIVYAAQNDVNTFINCVVTNNASCYIGGGVCVVNGVGNFVNCEVTGNTSTESSGGGVAVWSGSAGASFTNCSISGNTALTGGGVFSNGGAVTLTNSIVALNTSTYSETEEPNIRRSSGWVYGYNSLSTFTAWSNVGDAGVTNYVYDANLPLFSDVADGDYTLAQRSQAINRGANDYVTTEFDLGGGARIIADVVDLGAYEAQVVTETPSTVVTTAADVVDPTDELISLREAIAYASAGEVVTFDASLAGQTISLTTELLIDKSVSLDGGDNRVTLRGAGQDRVVRFAGADTDEYALTNLTITGGAAIKDGAKNGGGVYIANGRASIVNCSIVGNIATTSGGGVYVAGKGELTATNVLIADNSAKYGGGLYSYGASGKSVVLTNVTITSNDASTSGSGVHFESGSGTVEIRNSIIALNTGKPDVQKKTSTRIVKAYHTASSFTGWTSGSSGNLVYDAGRQLFVGGGDYSLAQGSQGVNAGDNAYVTFGTDLAGAARIVGASVDLGAYELQVVAETPSTIVTTSQDVVDAEDGLISLREAIAYAQPGETVTFAESLAGQTLTLTSELLLEKSVSIDGGDRGITVSGGDKVRVVRFYGEDTDVYTLSNLTLTGGAQASGAGVYVASGAANIVNCSVVGNTSTKSGGGIYVAGAGSANIVNTLIAENSAQYGGGVFAYGRSGKSVIITNSTITNNKATSNGSGLFTETGEGTLELRNSIVALNTVKSDVYKKTSTRNLIARNTLSTYTAWSSGSANNLAYDASRPLFVGSGDYTLAQGSQAVNVGDAEYVTSSTDLGGDARIVGSAVDLGAYELQVVAETPSTIVTTALDVVDESDGLISLREAIAYADAGGVVTFDASLANCTITLDSELMIGKSVVVDGGDRGITVSGGGKNRVVRFNGADSDTYALQNLTLTGGAQTSGAGVYVASGAANIVNCSVVGNTSTKSGGGIYVAGAGSANIVNTLIAENSAQYGGGVFAYGRSGKSVIITNSTITNNKATSNGSGLFTETGEGTLELRNSIVALNTVKGDVYKKTSTRNLIARNTLSTYTAWSSGSANNLAYSASQPLFVGGGDYALAPGSQALNAGDDSLAFGTEDLAGAARIVGAAVDLGAYELQVAVETPSTIVTTALDVVDETDGLISLREAVAYAQSGETVTFDSSLAGHTLTLTSQLEINKSVSVDGGDNNITVSGGDKVRVVYFGGADSDAYALTNLTLTQGANTHGAGVYVARGTASIVNCYVVGNHSTTSGGGVYVTGAGAANIVNTLVAENSAKYGGGVYSMGSAGKSVVITNSTITANSATSSGAGLHTESGAGTLELRNSIIALNTGKPDVQKKTATRVIMAHNTLSTFTAWSTGSAANLAYDSGQPLFVGNGDYSLARDSQAVNAGDAAYVTSSADLAGGARVVGGAVDLGAFELQSSGETPSTIVTTTADVIDESDGLISLREAIAYAQSGEAVTFASSLAGRTITLASELTIEKSVSIDGGDNNITVSGGGKVRVLRFVGGDADEYAISNLTITDGASTHGAGVYVAKGTATIVNCAVVGNTSSTSGGGVYIAGSGSANLVNTLVAENSAKYGGGVYSMGAVGKSVTLTNCTVTSNSATSSGAGLHLESGNGTVELRNSIIALNFGKPDVQKKTSTRVVKAHNTLSSFTGWSSGSGANLVYSASEPLFVGDGDYSLARDSQAVDRGADEYVARETDLLGNSRIVGASVDLGAYELQVSQEVPSTVVTTASDVVDETDGLVSLREAIAYANAGEVVTFAPTLAGQTITLTSELTVEKSVSVDGEALGLTLSGGGATRVMRFLGGAEGVYTLANLTLTDGYHERGAGVYVASGALEIVNCAIVGNHSTIAGGGVYIAGAGEASFVNTLIAENIANYGGGVYTMGAAGKSVVLTNCTIASNKATVSGAGLHMESGNGTVELRNTIVAANAGKPDVQKKTSTRVVKAHNTLSSFTSWSSGSGDNFVYTATQPLFTSATDFTLANGSQALDRGNDAYVEYEAELGGGDRIVGARVDLGAYERQETSSNALLDQAFAEFFDEELVELF